MDKTKAMSSIRHVYNANWAPRKPNKRVEITCVTHVVTNDNTKSKTFKVTIRFEVPVLRMYWDHQFVDPR